MKTVLITGGRGDISQEIKHLLQKREGYDVYTPGKEEMDVTDLQSIHAYMQQITPDILINNAGYVQPQTITEADDKKEILSIDINLKGVFLCTSTVLKKNPHAVVINIGSSAATKKHATWSSYCAAKAGVVMATQCWAEEGVETVCLSPGRTKTKMRKDLFPEEDQETLLDPKDFAKIVEYAILGKYEKGNHINVTKQNVKDLINDQEKN